MFGNKPLFLGFLAILLLAAYLRLTNLNNNPPGFYTDEASIGYNAYSILKNLHDEHGQFLPVFFEAFGEYKTPLAIYPVVLSEKIFGVNEFAVRIVQAVWGILAVALIYFLAKELWNWHVGLLSSLFLAISPWHVHLSRFNIESHNAFVALIMASTLFLLLAIRKQVFGYFLLSLVFFSLSFYAYFATRVFTPLYLLSLIVFLRKDLISFRKKIKVKFWLGVALFGFLILPYLLHMASGKGLARYRQVSIATQNLSLANIFTKSINLYLVHFEPKFVFITGDSDFPTQTILRHSVSGMGLAYKWQLPFFLIGVAAVLFLGKDRKDYQKKAILFLMLALFPLGSVVSDTTTPLATRSVIGVIPYTLLIAYGVYESIALAKNPVYRSVMIVVILSAGIFYFDRFIDLGRAYENRAYGYNGFQYGAREVVRYLWQHQDKYEAVVLYGGFDGPQAYINFYSLGQCRKCFEFDPYPQSAGLKLFSVAPETLNEFKSKYQGTLQKTIYYPDDREAFYIYEAGEQW